MRKLVPTIFVLSIMLLPLFAGSSLADPTVTPIASGLDSPRGLAFLPNGTLMVAEAGHGGDVCPPEAGGGCAGLTGQVSKINLATGDHTAIVTGLISITDPEGGAVGPSGLSTQGGRLLGIMGVFPQLFAQVDCTGLASDCAQVIAVGQHQAGALLKFTPSGQFKSIANVGAVDFQFTADNPGDGTYGDEVDANPYGLLAVPGGTYVADAGANTLDWVKNNGHISILVRFPVPDPPEPFPTDAVPTCVASAGDHLVVADLAGRIWKVTGNNATIISGQTDSIDTNNHYTGCASDAAGNVFVVSMFTGAFPEPSVAMTGSVLEVTPNGSVSTVTDGLFFPNKIAVGPHGDLYVSVGSICTTGGSNPCGTETGGVVKISR